MLANFMGKAVTSLTRNIKFFISELLNSPR